MGPLAFLGFDPMVALSSRTARRILTPCRPAAVPAGYRRSSSAPVPAPGLLAQLPDYVEGAKLVSQGKFQEALPPLQRATEVAEAYFPANASAAERVLCRSLCGQSLWQLGRFADSSAQFQSGLQEARSNLPGLVVSRLAEAAARAEFEVGRFPAAGALAVEAVAAHSEAPGPRLLVGALKAVDGTCVEATANLDDWSSSAEEAVHRTNGLVAAVLPDADDGKDQGITEASLPMLEDALGEAGPLARFLLPVADQPPVPQEGLPRLLCAELRSAAAQLAVAAGHGAKPWTRPLLVAALDDCEALRVEPADFDSEMRLRPLLFRTLASLGTLTGATGDHITAEGLFRSAVDSAEQSMQHPLAAGRLATGRGCLWRSLVYSGFADLLAETRRAEQRASEIAQLRDTAKALLPEGTSSLCHRDLRWSLVCLPPLKYLGPEELF